MSSQLEGQMEDVNPGHSLTFYGRDGALVGRLDFNGPALAFEGEAEESVQVFMHYLTEAFAGRLAEEAKRRDEAIEALRRAFNNLARYSFVKDGAGNVCRVIDSCGNWIDKDAAHALFDPVVVDSLVGGGR